MNDEFAAIEAKLKDEAVLRHVQARAVPVLEERQDQCLLRGTASLFCFEGRLFLISAAHVLKLLQGNSNLGVPIHFDQGEILCSLNGHLTVPRKAWADVAVFELLDNDVKEVLRRNWPTLGVTDAALYRHEYPVYIFCGYPGVLAREQRGAIRGSERLMIVSRYTGELHAEAEPAIPGADILMEFPNSIPADAVPRCQGMSGAAIWTLETEGDSAGPWHAGAIVKPAGVLTSVSHGGYIRGKQWHLLVHAFRSIDSEIAGQLRHTLEHKG